MISFQDGYLRATRHPWPCLLFLLPLLIAYEAGVWWLGGAESEALRNGVDAWLRWLLLRFGLPAMYWPPVLIAVVFLIASWLRRHDRPDDVPGVTLGIAVESVVFALLLRTLACVQAPVLERLDVLMTTPSDPAAGVARTISFVGAGIYEELLFRLLLFSFLYWLISLTEAPRFLAVASAVLFSAALFSGAHHLGPYGEPFDVAVFIFRMLAGVYFALLYRFRGFGVAVGAHACYDVLVGLAAG